MNNKINFLGPIFFWLFPAAMITLMSGLIYVSVQQNYRQNANDPQIQLAEDGARSLSSGSLPSLVVSAPSDVDMTQSLSPFIIVYDPTGRVIESSGQLNGTTPVPPSGVLDYVKAHGEDRFTWQPQADTRIAAVITNYNSSTNGAGFILAGRSLKEVEKRERALSIAVLIGWILGLIISFCGVYLVFYKILMRHRE